MIKKTDQIVTIDELSKNLPTIEMSAPEKVYITLKEMRTRSYELTVQEGDYVRMGQIIGERDAGYFTQPIHSTVSGTVGKVVKKFTYSGKKTEVLEIENDFKDELDERVKTRTDEEIASLSKEDVVAIVKENSIKGLGGAGFPTYIKMATDAKIDYIVLNGVECEPYLTADYQVMKNDAFEIYQGLEYVMKAMGTEKAIIGVKETKVDLIKSLRQVKDESFPSLNCEVVEVRSYYPQGWEVELVKNALGIEITPRTLLSDYGIIELNVTTAQAVYQAVKHNRPIMERYFTVTGDAIKNPSQMVVRVGDTIPNVVEACGGFSTEEDKVLVLGGPMMGANLMMKDAVVSITVASILAFKPQEHVEEPCVRCGSCVYSCPANLQPVQIMQAAKNRDKDAATALKVVNCIECGLCSYVCTSKIHVTDYMRKAKRLV